MGDGLQAVLVVLVVVFAVAGLVGLGVIGYVWLKYRPGFKAMAAMWGALAYTVSPIDPVPEAVFGPVGLLDDATVVGITIFIVRGAIAARRNRRAARQLR